MAKIKTKWSLRLLLNPEAFMLRIISINPKNRNSLPTKFLASLLGWMSQIEAKGDSFLGFRQTHCFYKRCKRSNGKSCATRRI